jgi:hypothetical protein
MYNFALIGDSLTNRGFSINNGWVKLLHNKYTKARIINYGYDPWYSFGSWNGWGIQNSFGWNNGWGGGFRDEPLRPGATDYSEWSISSRDGKKILIAYPYEVVFEDGTKWLLEK